MQAQAGIDHAGVAVAAELIQAQAGIFAQLQARGVGEFEGDAGIAFGLDGVTDVQLLASQNGACSPAIGAGQLDLASHRQHAGRRRFGAQPADRETQQLAGRQLVGVVDAVVLLQLLPAHRRLQVHATQVPQGIAGADPVVPVLGCGHGRQQEEGAEQRTLEAHGKRQRADEGHSWQSRQCGGAAARPHGPDLIPPNGSWRPYGRHPAHYCPRSVQGF
ncbi:hypothetical protein predicted by Glimmer/Critica [Stenotrophomonas maltophilia RA8]|nr:hypothetical protein predicted by Glimmer/Critica [Stenotrophomonas maltophilia RA8]